MRITPVALILLVACSSAVPSAAQESRKVLRIRPFTGDALSTGEATAAQNLVTSYVVELKSFRVIDAEGQELALREAETAVQLGAPKDLSPLAADYILSANAQSAGGLIVFTMDLTRVSSGEKRSVSDTAATVNDLILAMRRMTRSLFGQDEPSRPGADAKAPEPAAGAAAGAKAEGESFVAAPTLAAIVGTWSGDKGLDRVSIFRDGRGIAVLSSGNSMRVKANIVDEKVVVVQDQPSAAEFYRGAGLDLKAARAIAAQARPWRWIFSLTADASSLVGVKESVFVKIDANGVVTVDNNYVREARWSRLFR